MEVQTYWSLFQRYAFALAIGCGCVTEANAQSNAGNQLLQGVFDVIRNQSQANGSGHGYGSPSNGTAQINQASEQPARFPTRSAFMEATRQGFFAQVGQFNRDGQEMAARSIISALRTDYGVPPLPQHPACFDSFKSQTLLLLGLTSEVETLTLSNQPPDFVSRPSNNAARARDQLQTEMSHLRNSGGWCDAQIMGQSIPHTYKQAFPSFLAEYRNATQQWVETERTNRRFAYQSQLEQAKAEESQRQRDAQARDTARRANEQRQIDAERARIEQEQKQRAQKEKSRVAG